MYSKSRIYDPVNGNGGKVRGKSRKPKSGPVTVKRSVPVKFGDVTVNIIATVDTIKRPVKAELSPEDARFYRSL